TLLAARQQSSAEPIPARPGDLLDRRGRILATTTTAPSLYVDPSRVGEVDSIADRLAGPLNLDPDRLAKRIRSNSHRQFLWIKRRLTAEEAAAVRGLNLPSVFG